MWQWASSGGVRPFLGKQIHDTIAFLQGPAFVLILASHIREISFVFLEAQDKFRFRINPDSVTPSGP